MIFPTDLAFDNFVLLLGDSSISGKVYGPKWSIRSFSKTQRPKTFTFRGRYIFRSPYIITRSRRYSYRKKSYTRGLPKCPKIAVTEIGHLYEYAYRCKNTPFSLWNEAFWHRWLERDQIDVEMPHFRLHPSHRCQKASFQREKRNGPFWHRYAYSYKWPISVTAILGHFGNPRVMSSCPIKFRNII